MHSYNEQLLARALFDLTMRAKSGILTYACIWLILAFSYEINTNHPAFFIINSATIFLIFVSRVWHFLLLKKQPHNNVYKMSYWLELTILAAAAHWGTMTAWILYNDSLNDLQTVILIITPAIALGGACTLSISSKIRMLYPTLMFIPFIGILVYQADTQSLSLAAITSIGLVYIFTATKATHDDYWAAVTNHMVAEERAQLMEKLSTTDPLTQLKNRMYFDKKFEKEWLNCTNLKRPISLVMLDLDFFKKINDNYGHVFGDECLKAVASTISQIATRPTDCVARYGGEEFVILLPNTDDETTKMLALRMINAIASLVLNYQGEKISLTCSIGGSTITPQIKANQTSLLKAADSALYQAKDAGRNCYRSNTTHAIAEHS